MGVYSPVELYDRCASNIQSRVTEPLRKALNSGELNFCGVLYVGLMVDSGNNPHILEFNARFGDPETQALMPLLDSDLAEILWQCVEGKLAKEAVAWKNAASCCVVAAARHYPGSSSKGETIKIGALPSNSQIFHAGTAIVENKLVTQGGRVLAVTAVGSDLSTARDLAYKALDSVTFSDMDYRKDIARRATQQCLSN
jgi:phosphoribosylamine--glycine ligase